MNESMLRHPAVVAYLDAVCSRIKAKAVHDEIRQEIAGHLEEIMAEKMEDGLTEAQAVAEALRHMGDPIEVGAGLHAAHRPRTDWNLIGLSAVMIAIALVSLLVLNASDIQGFVLLPKLICGGAGIAAMIAMIFVNYRVLLRLSWPLYWGTIILLAIAQVYGTTINGSTRWIMIGSFGFNIYDVSPYLLLIAIAGLLQLEKERPVPDGRYEQAAILLRNIILFAMVPVFFYILSPSMAPMLFYVLGLSCLLLYCGRWRLVLAAGASGIAMLWLWFTINPYRYGYQWIRLKAYISQDPHALYQSIKAMEAIRSGGLWGQGLDHANNIPYSFSEMLFAYLVHSLGWVFGAVIIVSVLLIAGRMLTIGARLRDGYASKLVVAMTAVLALRMLWNILMCLGWLPVVGLELPLIMWHSGTVVEFAALGLVLSAYRRKDMLGSPSSPASIA